MKVNRLSRTSKVGSLKGATLERRIPLRSRALVKAAEEEEATADTEIGTLMSSESAIHRYLSPHC